MPSLAALDLSDWAVFGELRRHFAVLPCRILLWVQWLELDLLGTMPQGSSCVAPSCRSLLFPRLTIQCTGGKVEQQSYAKFKLHSGTYSSGFLATSQFTAGRRTPERSASSNAAAKAAATPQGQPPDFPQFMKQTTCIAPHHQAAESVDVHAPRISELHLSGCAGLSSRSLQLEGHQEQCRLSSPHL